MHRFYADCSAPNADKYSWPWVITQTINCYHWTYTELSRYLTWCIVQCESDADLEWLIRTQSCYVIMERSKLCFVARETPLQLFTPPKWVWCWISIRTRTTALLCSLCELTLEGITRICIVSSRPSSLLKGTAKTFSLTTEQLRKTVLWRKSSITFAGSFIGDTAEGSSSTWTDKFRFGVTFKLASGYHGNSFEAHDSSTSFQWSKEKLAGVNIQIHVCEGSWLVLILAGWSRRNRSHLGLTLQVLHELSIHSWLQLSWDSTIWKELDSRQSSQHHYLLQSPQRQNLQILLRLRSTGSHQMWRSQLHVLWLRETQAPQLPQEEEGEQQTSSKESQLWWSSQRDSPLHHNPWSAGPETHQRWRRLRQWGCSTPSFHPWVKVESFLLTTLHSEHLMQISDLSVRNQIHSVRSADQVVTLTLSLPSQHGSSHSFQQTATTAG